MHALIHSQPCASAPQEVTSPRLTDVHGAAKMYGPISWRTFLRWADAGLVPAGVKIGGRRLWSIAALEKHISEGAKPLRKGVR